MNLLEVELPPEVPVEEARLLLVVKLFEAGRLSLGQAAKLAGYSKPTLSELMSKMDVPVINYPAEESYQEGKPLLDALVQVIGSAKQLFEKLYDDQEKIIC